MPHPPSPSKEASTQTGSETSPRSRASANASACSGSRRFTSSTATHGSTANTADTTGLATPTLLASLTSAATLANSTRLNVQTRILSNIDSLVRRSAIAVCDRVVEPVVDRVVDTVKTRVLVPVARKGRELWRREAIPAAARSVDLWDRCVAWNDSEKILSKNRGDLDESSDLASSEGEVSCSESGQGPGGFEGGVEGGLGLGGLGEETGEEEADRRRKWTKESVQQLGNKKRRSSKIFRPPILGVARVEVDEFDISALLRENAPGKFLDGVKKYLGGKGDENNISPEVVHIPSGEAEVNEGGRDGDRQGLNHDIKTPSDPRDPLRSHLHELDPLHGGDHADARSSRSSRSSKRSNGSVTSTASTPWSSFSPRDLLTNWTFPDDDDGENEDAGNGRDSFNGFDGASVEGGVEDFEDGDDERDDCDGSLGRRTEVLVAEEDSADAAASSTSNMQDLSTTNQTQTGKAATFPSVANLIQTTCGFVENRVVNRIDSTISRVKTKVDQKKGGWRYGRGRGVLEVSSKGLAVAAWGVGLAGNVVGKVGEAAGGKRKRKSREDKNFSEENTSQGRDSGFSNAAELSEGGENRTASNHGLNSSLTETKIADTNPPRSGRRTRELPSRTSPSSVFRSEIKNTSRSFCGLDNNSYIPPSLLTQVGSSNRNHCRTPMRPPGPEISSVVDDSIPGSLGTTDPGANTSPVASPLIRSPSPSSTRTGSSTSSLSSSPRSHLSEPFRHIYLRVQSATWSKRVELVWKRVREPKPNNAKLNDTKTRYFWTLQPAEKTLFVPVVDLADEILLTIWKNHSVRNDEPIGHVCLPVLHFLNGVDENSKGRSLPFMLLREAVEVLWTSVRRKGNLMGRSSSEAADTALFYRGWFAVLCVVMGLLAMRAMQSGADIHFMNLVSGHWSTVTAISAVVLSVVIVAVTSIWFISNSAPEPGSFREKYQAASSTDTDTPMPKEYRLSRSRFEILPAAFQPGFPMIRNTAMDRPASNSTELNRSHVYSGGTFDVAEEGQSIEELPPPQHPVPKCQNLSNSHKNWGRYADLSLSLVLLTDVFTGYFSTRNVLQTIKKRKKKVVVDHRNSFVNERRSWRALRKGLSGSASEPSTAEPAEHIMHDDGDELNVWKATLRPALWRCDFCHMYREILFESSIGKEGERRRKLREMREGGREDLDGNLESSAKRTILEQRLDRDARRSMNRRVLRQKGIEYLWSDTCGDWDSARVASERDADETERDSDGDSKPVDAGGEGGIIDDQAFDETRQGWGNQQENRGETGNPSGTEPELEPPAPLSPRPKDEMPEDGNSNSSNNLLEKEDVSGEHDLTESAAQNSDPDPDDLEMLDPDETTMLNFLHRNNVLGKLDVTWAIKGRTDLLRKFPPEPLFPLIRIIGNLRGEDLLWELTGGRHRGRVSGASAPMRASRKQPTPPAPSPPPTKPPSPSWSPRFRFSLIFWASFTILASPWQLLLFSPFFVVALVCWSLAQNCGVYPPHWEIWNENIVDKGGEEALLKQAASENLALTNEILDQTVLAADSAERIYALLSWDDPIMSTVITAIVLFCSFVCCAGLVVFCYLSFEARVWCLKVAMVSSLLILCFFPFREAFYLLRHRSFDELIPRGVRRGRSDRSSDRGGNNHALTDRSTDTLASSIATDTVARTAVKYLMRGIDRLWLRLPTWEVTGRRYLAACQRYSA